MNGIGAVSGMANMQQMYAPLKNHTAEGFSSEEAHESQAEKARELQQTAVQNVSTQGTSSNGLGNVVNIMV